MVRYNFSLPLLLLVSILSILYIWCDHVISDLQLMLHGLQFLDTDQQAEQMSKISALSAVKILAECPSLAGYKYLTSLEPHQAFEAVQLCSDNVARRMLQDLSTAEIEHIAEVLSFTTWSFYFNTLAIMKRWQST